MNKVILIGRLTKDPDVRYQSNSGNQMCIARYTLAVDRKRAQNQQPSADFISCVAFGKAGEFVEKYLSKGMKIAITGRIQTGSYTDDKGYKHYTTDVIVEEHEFCESKKNGDVQASITPATDEEGFMNIPDNIEEELPFS